MDLKDLLKEGPLDSVTKKSEVDWILNINKMLEGTESITPDLISKMDDVIVIPSQERAGRLSEIIKSISDNKKSSQIKVDDNYI